MQVNEFLPMGICLFCLFPTILCLSGYSLVFSAKFYRLRIFFFFSLKKLFLSVLCLFVYIHPSYVHSFHFRFLFFIGQSYNLNTTNTDAHAQKKERDGHPYGETMIMSASFLLPTPSITHYYYYLIILARYC